MLIAVAVAAAVTRAADPVEEPLAILTHDDLVLSAKLTRPSTGPIVAGVVLLHGSGATDMDQTVPAALTSTGRAERPFADLADRLARSGFAVLRYNKRGVESDPRQNDPHVIETTGVADLVADAMQAVSLMRATGVVRPERVVLLGHSEGSVVGSLVAERDPAIAGLACISPMARGLAAILHYQLVERVLTWAFAQVDSDHDGRLSREELAAHPRYRIPAARLDQDGDGTVDHRELACGLEADWQRFLKGAEGSPWMREHLSLETNLERMPRLALPIQLFHGEEDAQTPLDEARSLARALARRPSGPATLDTFPGLGHGLAPPLAPDRPTVGPIVAPALDAIAARLLAVYGRGDATRTGD